MGTVLEEDDVLARAAVAASVISLATPQHAATARPETQPATVLTFNIRFGTAKDGVNSWVARRGMLFDVMRQADADLVGLQEALDFQIDEIVAAVPGYGVVGVGRDDGRRAGEYAAILFRAARFRVSDAGTFWFSDTPAVPGSKWWGNNVTRICTWARFVDASGLTFWHYNVHLDHESQPSRERSTALLRQRIDARASAHEPVIVTGDFNVGESNAALIPLLGARNLGDAGAPGAPFVDTFRIRHRQDRDVGTFTGFTFGKIDGDKIDYVLVQPGIEVLSSGILHNSRDGRYPSDHFPVVARVLLKAPSP